MPERAAAIGAGSSVDSLNAPVPAVYMKSIVYGFVRFHLTRAESREWHCWSLFLQSNTGQDLSTFISKVSFIIHPDFTLNVRSIYEPPYEISVLGQLSFDAYIHVFYRDPQLPPSFFKVNIAFDGTSYSRRIIPDLLVFVSPRKWFAKLLDIQRPAQVKSGILHHLHTKQFISGENLKGKAPTLIDATVDGSAQGPATSTFEGSFKEGTRRQIVSFPNYDLIYEPINNTNTVGFYIYDREPEGTVSRASMYHGSRRGTAQYDDQKAVMALINELRGKVRSIVRAESAPHPMVRTGPQ